MQGGSSTTYDCGSIASQGFGLAAGIQDKFSFKQVALAAIGGALPGKLLGSAFLGDVAKGALGSQITQDTHRCRGRSRKA